MDNITIKNGNLLDANEQYICHQCNCVTKNSKYLAQHIFTRYPYANTYKTRTSNTNPGTIDIKGNGTNQRYIINMYAQYYPGKAKYSNDNPKVRLEWFKLCLHQIAQIKNINSVAMPFNIGCGSAGGDWNTYYKLIKEFVINNNITVVLYKFE